MRRTCRSAAAGAVTLATLGCAVLGACSSGSVRAGETTLSNTRTGPGVKTVAAKLPPERLVAEDGTTCDVSPDVFRETAVGNLFDCPDWRDEPPR